MIKSRSRRREKKRGQFLNYSVSVTQSETEPTGKGRGGWSEKRFCEAPARYPNNCWQGLGEKENFVKKMVNI